MARIAPDLHREQVWWSQGLQVAGVDEVGRGCLAGPVVAAAVLLQPGAALPGVRDSKQVSAAQREALVPLIYAQSLAVSIASVDAADIDRLNILQATRVAMVQAVQALAVVPHHILIDGREPIDLPLTQSCIIGGDALCVSIAAASIVAKVHRDQLMRDFDGKFPQYGFARHKGYGTALHLAALAEHGPMHLHRYSFAPVRRAVPLTLQIPAGRSVGA